MYKFTLDYAIKQDLPNQAIATGLIAIAFLISPKRFKKHFLLLFALPAYMGSIFPDLSYFFLYFIMRSESYTLAHTPSFALLVIPAAQIGIYLLNKYILKKELPEYWYMIASLVALSFAWVHIVADKLGF